MTGPLDVPAIEALADEALAGGTWVRGAGVYVVADVCVLEWACQGHETPHTWRLRRPDGREVYVYRDQGHRPAGCAPSPASPEVIRHHTAAHAERCPAGGYEEKACPCAMTVAIVCTSCAEPVFLMTAPTADPCIHAQALGGQA
jgi:hypothetical protein